MIRPSLVFRLALPLLALGLAAALLFGSIRAVRSLEREREAFLRSRAVGVAVRLESLAGPEEIPRLRELLKEEDPAVAGIELFDYDDPASGAPASLREKRRLFEVQRSVLDGENVFRVWLPSHLSNRVYLARIDLVEEVVARLVEPAEQNVWVASVGALVVILLALTVAWSARRAARAEQRQLELEHLAQIGQMSAALAHEIRNPLGTIKGFAQLLGEQLGARHRELLEPLLSQTTRLEQLVNDLLLYGKPPQPRMREVDVAALGETMRAHIIQAVGSRPARLRIEAPPLRLTSDPALIEQALLNLVRNAVEAVPEGAEPELSLVFSLAPGEVVITVSDNGPGLSAELKEHLYEPFRTTKAFGTGLGLAITRKLVESLGGRLIITNQPQGGVAAAIRLPETNRK